MVMLLFLNINNIIMVYLKNSKFYFNFKNKVKESIYGRECSRKI